jgi:peptidoglycan/LPS O-acetylase OafA/YrhL
MTPLRLTWPSPVTGRLGCIDELKGVAIILVILYHALGVLAVRNNLHGELGVDIFVILSGVGLSLGASKEGDALFLMRRFWRIYPAYWIVLTAFIAANGFFLGRHYSALSIGLHYLGVQSWFGDRYATDINDSFWFITLISALYILYIPLRRLTGRPDLLLFFGSSLTLIVSLIYFRAGQPVGFDHVSLRIPGFLIGMLAGRLLKSGSLEIPVTPALAAAFLIIFYLPYFQGFVFVSVWVGLALMIFYAFAIRPALGAAPRAALSYLGSRSLEIFLIHQPLIREYNILVQSLLWPGGRLSTWSVALGTCVGLALALALSAGLHRLLRWLPLPGPLRSPAIAA